ncbi:MAG: hypothetical protein HYV97_01485 [Bdellovibrio sp.]|nr:hypothetical protein [Bdellovibrio sp.]
MKHPRLSTLQDYFENEMNEIQIGLLKEHLLDCDQCTLILSQMAKVDNKVKSVSRIPISEQTKKRIFTEAKARLQAKRNKLDVDQHCARNREERMKELKDLLRNALSEFRAPALQVASLGTVIGFIVLAIQTEQPIVSKPLTEGVVIYTHGEKDSPIEGEIE